MLWYTTQTMPIFSDLRVVLGWSRYSDIKLYMLGVNVLYRMTDNLFFPKPPVSLADLEFVLDKFRSSMAATLDGGSPKAYAEKTHWREQLMLTLRPLGNYVDDMCKGDPANLGMLLSSGFEAQPMSRTSPKPLEVPLILRIKQGRTGELIIFHTPLGRAAKAYDVDWKVQDEPDTPEAWQRMKATSARDGVRIEGLKPGMVYVFRVRAYSRLGYTDWSPLVARMCI